ncbi:hypothetical protein RAA17_00860 [Komagataeibacter rhaeticus]|nr:hypothetical protein [Komagataeibacter rhaeticus]
METAMLMIGKFTVALQTFLDGQKWDTAGGDLKPDTVPDMVDALKAAATGALVPFEHDPVSFSVRGRWRRWMTWRNTQRPMAKACPRRWSPRPQHIPRRGRHRKTGPSPL